MKDIIEVIAFKCPYCGCVNKTKSNIYNHMKRCRENPDYTQKCISCQYLEHDYLLRSIDGKPLCIFEGNCPYKHHDKTEVMDDISKSKFDYMEYLSNCGLTKDNIDEVMQNEWKG